MTSIPHPMTSEPADFHDGAPWPTDTAAEGADHAERMTFRSTVAQWAARARAKLPDAVHGRLEAATKLVLQHDVLFLNDGTVEVGSSSDPMKTYIVRGRTCSCQDFMYSKAPEGLCQHILAACIQQRVSEEMARQTPQAAVVPAPAPEVEPEPHDAVPGIPPQFITMIQGRPFVRFDGLLSLGHARGLVELSTTVVVVTEAMAVCQCVARFTDGLVVTDIGDASPGNVKKHLAPHWIRIAATRASARALRRALNVDAVALEELGEDAP